MKVIGLILILLSSTLIGLAAGQDLSERIAAMEQVEQMLQLLRGELRCSYIPFPQAFCQVADRVASPWKEFLRDLSVRLERMSGSRMQELWAEAVDGLPENCGLAGEDRKELSALGKELGYLDLTMQLNTLEHFEERWKRRMDNLREELPAKRRIFRCLGICAGVAMALILW